MVRAVAEDLRAEWSAPSGAPTATTMSAHLCSALEARTVQLAELEGAAQRLRVVLTSGRARERGTGREGGDAISLTQHPQLEEVLLDGEAWAGSVGGTLAEGERLLLEWMGAPHALVLPVVVGLRTWGAVLVTREQAAFTPDEIALGQVLVAAMAPVLARRDVEGPQSALADAHAFHAHAAALISGSLVQRPLQLVVARIHWLRQDGGGLGWEAADEVRGRMAALLIDRTRSWGDVVVAELGGDEFGIVAAGRPSDSLEAKVAGVREAVRGMGDPVDITWGSIEITEPPVHPRSPEEAAAAALQLARASRDLEPSGVRAASPGAGAPVPDELVRLVADVFGELDAMPSERMSHRLALVAERSRGAINGALWWVGRVEEGVVVNVRQGRRPSGRGAVDPLPEPEDFELASYRASADAAEGLAMHTDLTRGDVQERLYLAAAGFEGIFACGGYDPDAHQWLVEIFTDAQSAPTPWLAPVLEGMVQAALSFPRGVDVPLQPEEALPGEPVRLWSVAD
ncbi:hypothetical protein ASG73_06350 [Janibacter sp. Soil728]|nr:hypothetical protein ASG73_06350 [Janibacter sp. Soil728]